jgi:3-oxoacyl-[acyl-carrier protein] reductase
MKSMNLEGKVAIVTGASRGIGLASMLALGELGATVVGTATSEQGATNISQTLESHGLKGFGRVLRIEDKAQVEALVKGLSDEVGAPTIVVNNAGITRDNLMLRMKDQEWDDIISTNLTGAFYLSRACLKPMMKARWGRIINVSSVVGSTGNAGQANYAAAKAGLIGMSKSLAQEVGSRGITVNVVAPGFIDTDMTRGLADAQREALLKSIPMNQLGQPENIANAIAFLASELASYVTGETLHVNGGMYMA